MQDALIECEAFPGAFSDEMVVQVANREFVVAKEEVTSIKSGRAALRVKVIDGKGDGWVVLPTAYSDVVSKRGVVLVSE